MSPKAPTKKTPDAIEDTLFEELDNLLYEKDWEKLKKRCDGIIRKWDDVYDLHLAYAFKAKVQAKEGKESIALRNIDKALFFCPGCPWVMFTQLEIAEGRAQERERPGDWQYALELAQAFIKRGTKGLLKHEHLNSTLRKGTEHMFIVDTWFLLGFIYQGLGDLPKARRAMEKFLELCCAGNIHDFTKQEARELLRSIAKQEQEQFRGGIVKGLRRK